MEKFVEALATGNGVGIGLSIAGSIYKLLADTKDDNK
jgi:hypothetical protein